MNDYIKLNNKLFSYVSRKSESEEIGTKLERTLNGTAYKDIITTKTKWSFLFEVDERNLSRLQSIFNTHVSITLLDWDGITLSTVLWNNSFAPNFEGEGIYTITIELEEV